MNWGFNWEFPNGYTISVKWGAGNYGDNHMEPFDRGTCKGWESTTAEIAMFKGGDWLDPETMEVIPNGGNDVKGWLTVSEVLDYMNRLAAL